MLNIMLRLDCENVKVTNSFECQNQNRRRGQANLGMLSIMLRLDCKNVKVTDSFESQNQNRRRGQAEFATLCGHKV